MATSMIMAGLGLAAAGFGARYVIRTMPHVFQKMNEAAKNMPMLDSKSLANSKYYKGGFEPKMTKREASLILNVSPNVNAAKLKSAYMRIILINHPDKGGSPYVAAKISEAKDLLEK